MGRVLYASYAAFLVGGAFLLATTAACRPLYFVVTTMFVYGAIAFAGAYYTYFEERK